jgi:hypothetical protein
MTGTLPAACAAGTGSGRNVCGCERSAARSGTAVDADAVLGEPVDPRRLDRAQREPVEPVDDGTARTVDGDETGLLEDLQVSQLTAACLDTFRPAVSWD